MDKNVKALFEIDYSKVIFEAVEASLERKYAELSDEFDEIGTVSLTREPDQYVEPLLDRQLYLEIATETPIPSPEFYNRRGETGDTRARLFRASFHIEPESGLRQFKDTLGSALSDIKVPNCELAVSRLSGLIVCYPLTDDEDTAEQCLLDTIKMVKVIETAWNEAARRANQKLKVHCREKQREYEEEYQKFYGPVEKAVKKHGIELRRRHSAPSLNLKKKTLQQPSKVLNSKPAFEREVFLQIVEKVKEIASYLETTPWLFKGLSEESLRTIILAIFNAAFSVQGVAEGFRGIGKTDIIIPFEGKDCFVAECKKWNGPNTLPTTLKQCLDYLKWEDNQACLIFFVTKNQDFSKVITSTHSEFKTLSGYKEGSLTTTDQSRHFSFKLEHHPQDSGKTEFEMHTIFINLYSSQQPKRK